MGCGASLPRLVTRGSTVAPTPRQVDIHPVRWPEPPPIVAHNTLPPPYTEVAPYGHITLATSVPAKLVNSDSFCSWNCPDVSTSDASDSRGRHQWASPPADPYDEVQPGVATLHLDINGGASTNVAWMREASSRRLRSRSADDVPVGLLRAPDDMPVGFLRAPDDMTVGFMRPPVGRRPYDHLGRGRTRHTSLPPLIGLPVHRHMIDGHIQTYSANGRTRVESETGDPEGGRVEARIRSHATLPLMQRRLPLQPISQDPLPVELGVPVSPPIAVAEILPRPPPGQGRKKKKRRKRRAHGTTDGTHFILRTSEVLT